MVVQSLETRKGDRNVQDQENGERIVEDPIQDQGNDHKAEKDVPGAKAGKEQKVPIPVTVEEAGQGPIVENVSTGVLAIGVTIEVALDMTTGETEDKERLNVSKEEKEKKNENEREDVIEIMIETKKRSVLGQ